MLDVRSHNLQTCTSVKHLHILTENMKFSAALFAMAAYVVPVHAATTRNAVEDPVAAASDRRRLTSMEKYTTSGYGASADVYWANEGCAYGSYASIYATDGTSKYQSNGKPGTYTSTYAYGYYDNWYNCDETSATHTYFNMNAFDNNNTQLAVNKAKLSTASASATANVYLVTEQCSRVCEFYDGDDDYFPDGYEWCYYSECTTTTDGFVDASISGLWTAEGAVYTSNARNTFNYPGGYSGRYTSKGKVRDAGVTLSVTVDGGSLDIFTQDSYASIFQNTDGTISKY